MYLYIPPKVWNCTLFLGLEKATESLFQFQSIFCCSLTKNSHAFLRKSESKNSDAGNSHHVKYLLTGASEITYVNLTKCYREILLLTKQRQVGGALSISSR